MPLQKKFPSCSWLNMFGEYLWSVSLECCICFQIKGMKERLDFWCGDVKNMAMLVEQQAHDILT